jgi:hypothetical protein
MQANSVLTLDLDHLTRSDALEVAERLRKIAALPAISPAERRTTRHLAEIAEALDRAALG